MAKNSTQPTYYAKELGKITFINTRDGVHHSSTELKRRSWFVFHEFGSTWPSSCASRYAPVRSAVMTVKGPSHRGESLCKPERFWTRRKTKSPTRSVLG